MEIAGVNAFVTGATSRTGKETALALARAGSPVTATDVDAKGLAQLANLRLRPTFRTSHLSETFPTRNAEWTNKIIAAFREAGLPE